MELSRLSPANATLKKSRRLRSFSGQMPLHANLTSRAAARRQSGQALLETAFTMLAFLALLFGVLEISLGLYAYHYISYAAREGTRFAIVRGSACNPAFISYCPAGPSDVSNYVTGLGFPGINTSSSVMTVTPMWCQVPTTQPPTNCASSNTWNNPGNLVQVTVTYNVPLALPFVSTHVIQVSSTSEMVISQ